MNHVNSCYLEIITYCFFYSINMYGAFPWADARWDIIWILALMNDFIYSSVTF